MFTNMYTLAKTSLQKIKQQNKKVAVSRVVIGVRTIGSLSLAKGPLVRCLY